MTDKIFKQKYLSKEEYRDAKKLIGFNPNHFIWKDDKQQYLNLKA